MYSTLCLLALVGFAAANPQFFVAKTYDDGQWHPELDGSVLGSGYFRWGLEDGSWKPHMDGSALGRGDLSWLSRKRRDVSPLPADEPINAIAKNNLMIQQRTEAVRNAFGGIPIDLPADTPAVAAGKQAHAIAHEHQKLLTSGVYSPLVQTYAAPAYHSYPAYGYGVTPYSFAASYPYTHGFRTFY